MIWKLVLSVLNTRKWWIPNVMITFFTYTLSVKIINKILSQLIIWVNIMGSVKRVNVIWYFLTAKNFNLLLLWNESSRIYSHFWSKWEVQAIFFTLSTPIILKKLQHYFQIIINYYIALFLKINRFNIDFKIYLLLDPHTTIPAVLHKKVYFSLMVYVVIVCRKT